MALPKIFTGRAGYGQSRFFGDQAYHFQTLRALNDIQADGADTMEVLETITHIRQGDAQSWFRAWQKTGDRLLQRAEKITDSMSRGQAYLRAHNYLRTAEFFLPPNDTKRPLSFEKNVKAFGLGLDALGVHYERIRVPYGQHHLNAIYYPGPAGADVKALIVFCGGYDSTLEELYFALVRGAHARGYSVLTYEGPGQGSVLREQKLGFTPEWEKPTRAVVDTFLAGHARPPKMVLVGMSMGGYLAPRAAAFDDRFDGVVAYDVFYDFGAAAERNVPGFVMTLHRLGLDKLVQLLVGIKSWRSPGLAWVIRNGMWAMNTGSAMQTLEALRAYTLENVAGQIKADVLIFAGVHDHFVPVSQAVDFQQRLTAARSVTTVVYDGESGGAEHCQLGAQTLWHADFFDWMEKKFGPDAGEKVAERTTSN
jgi:alpha-beta hydrolase superfamily lysophospholipase